MKKLFYVFGILLYAVIAAAIRTSGYILGAIPTMLLFSFTVYLIPRILIKCWEWNRTREKKNKAKKVSAKLNIPEDILAHCEFVGNNEQLANYLQTCVDKGLLTQDQSAALFNAYKQK